MINKRDISRAIRYAIRFGARGLPMYLASRTGRSYQLSLRHWTHPICLRGDPSDAAVFEQVFLWREYELRDDALRESVETVVDLGGHIGMSAISFAIQFPKARIVVVEPDEENFQQLVMNTSGCSRRTCQ